MIIHKLELTSFGKFQNYVVEFDQSFNIIEGNNEAGKTTIHKFIEGMLFGFLDPTKSRRHYTDDHAKYQPKNASSYRGSMTLTVDGKTYRIDRNFDKKQLDVTIYDAQNGQDITDQLQIHQSTKLPDISELIGISYKLYQNTISISQILRNTEKDLGQALIERLHNITTTKDESISIQEIQNDIQKSLANIGSAKAKTKPYAKAIDEVEDIKAMIKDSSKKYEESERLFKEKNHIQKTILDAQNHLETLDKDIHQVANDKKKEQFYKAEKLKKQIEENERKILINKDDMNLKEKDYEALLDIKNDLRYAQQKKAETKHHKETIEQTLSNQEKELAKHSAFTNYTQSIYQFRDLFYARNNTQDDVEQLSQNLKQVEQELSVISIDEQVIEDHNTVESLIDEKNALDITTQQLKVDNLDLRYSSSKSKNSTFIHVLVLIVSYLLYPLVIGVFIHKKWTQTQSKKETNSALLREKLEEEKHILAQKQTRHEEIAKKVNQVLSSYKVNQQAELAQVRRHEEQKLQDKKTLEKRHKDIEEELSQKKKTLEEQTHSFDQQCHKLGISKLKTKQELDQFEQAFNHHKHIEEQTRKTKKDHLQLQDALTKIEQQMTELQENYHTILSNANRETIEQFKHGLQVKQDMHQLQKENDQLLHRLHDLTDQRNLSDFQKDIDFNLAQYEGSHTLEQLEDDRNKTRTRIRSLESEAYELDKDISIIEETYTDVPTLTHMLEKAETDLKQIKEEKDAFELVATVIDDLSKEIQYEFAPSLNQAISDVMKIVTDGKYSDLKIDANTNIKIVDDYLKQLLEADDFSTGTIDQIYFSMRLGLSNVLFNQSFPYMLDDTFVNYDRTRLKQVLHLLAKEHRQILLFTCHKREHAIAKEDDINHEYISLT